jgi:hypothetical protein
MTSSLADIEAAVRTFERARLHPVVSAGQLAAVEQALGRAIPQAYRDFLGHVSNGAELNQFTLFPVFDAAGPRQDAKRTWNSVQRNNSHESAPWFDRDPATFEHFFVFGTDGAACFALQYGQEDEAVWLWEAGSDEVVELDYSFADWLAESAKHDLG